MTVSEGRKVEASLAQLHARLEGRAEEDREMVQQLAELTHTFEALQARWVSSGEVTKLAAVPARMTGELAAVQARADQIAEKIQHDALAHAELAKQLEKRLAVLEQSDAQLANKVGLSIPDDREELWRQAASLLASGHQGEARRDYQAFVDRFPQDRRAAGAYLAIGGSYATEARYSNAAAAYERLLSVYPGSPEVPEAMWQLSRAFVQLSFCSDARALLRDLVARYPGSQEAGEAVKQLKDLQKPTGRSECVS